MMICLATFEDLHNQQHDLGLYCMHCDRWGSADLEALIRSGRGARQISTTRFRCRDCGKTVEKQVQPPVPALGDTVQYVSPGQALR